MSRSSKKGPYVDAKLMKKIIKLRQNISAGLGQAAVINTWARASEIAPEMIGFTIGVHNGKQFIPVTIKEEMVGHRLGEFSPTRKFIKHGGKMQREIEKGQGTAPAAATNSKS